MYTKTILDERAKNKQGVYPVVVRVFLNRSRYIQIGLNIYVRPTQFSEGRVLRHSDAARMNSAIATSLTIINKRVEELDKSCNLQDLTSSQIRGYIRTGVLVGADGIGCKIPARSGLLDLWQEVVGAKKADSTRRSYTNGLRQFTLYLEERGLSGIDYDQVTKAFIEAYKAWLEERYAQNSVASLITAFRNVWNVARSREITTRYPFLGVKAPVSTESGTEPLSLDQIKAIRDYKTDSPSMALARDVFMIEFYLLGINTADLVELRLSDKVRYERKKTGTKYEFSIQPELRPYMERYKDPKGERMFSFRKERRGSDSTLAVPINMKLKELGEKIGCQGLHLYHARHTFATLASRECGISLEDIALMLGHKTGYRMTSRYARPAYEKIDINARKVFDLLLV